VIVIGSGALILIVTLLAGYYPAWVISAVRPAEILKGKMQSSSKGVQLRRTLVVFQFVISVGLVLCTFVVIRQLEFMRNENLGFNKEQVIVLNSSRATVNDRSVYSAFKNDLRSLAAVQQVTCTNSVPGRQGWRGQISYSENTPKGESVSAEYLAVDEDYVETLGLKVIAGRNFDEKRETDLKDGLLINETAASLYGWTITGAIDKKITSPSGYPAGTVIGVVKDYHQSGLQQRIGPVVMDINPGRYYAIRFLTGDTRNLIASLQASWKKRFPENEFNYFFLDEDFERQYQTEKRLANVFEVFSGLTILIAVIGLLGLVSFLVESRTKEIGIRKVLGAGILNIAQLLSKEFLILVMVANGIAIPLAGYFANLWLQEFAYRTTLGIGLFAVTFFLAMGLTLVTVSFQTIKAAMADPVKSLRYE
jgi:putative ABC transport system permease protein